jgi:hypothetical protein
VIQLHSSFEAFDAAALTAFAEQIAGALTAPG